jgi:hypothetical protein
VAFLDREIGQRDAGGATEPLEAHADEMQRILDDIEHTGPRRTAVKRCRHGAPLGTATSRSRAKGRSTSGPART